MTDPHQILQEHWGHKAFRPLQEEIVRSAAEGHDTLALLPTGGGKSICFQVPALMREGVCLVISPLIALMKDQVENLQKRGIQAEAVHSLLRFREVDKILDKAAAGELKFLYLSPERLQTQLFQERLKRMKVGLIAVDEAHCISQWGHDFRPAFRNVHELREKLPGVPVLALTASATPRVEQDILGQLEMKDPRVFRASYLRPNLTYLVRKVDDRIGKLAEALKRSQGSAIVYAGTRRHTVEYARHLSQLGFEARPYHAGLTPEDKARNQEEWIKGKFRVMVATNAFGMGIDKPDVRLVAHLDIPLEPEAYFQEAGRAGRDGEPAYALLICSQRQADELEERARSRFPDKQVIRKVYRLLCNRLNIPLGGGKDRYTAIDLVEFAKQAGIPALELFNSLRLLELAGYVELNDAIHQPARLMITASREVVYDFQVRNAKLDPVIKLLLRSYGGLFDIYTRIDEQRLANTLKMSLSQFRDALQQLTDFNIADYVPSSDDPGVTLLQDRVDEQFLRFPKEVYEDRLDDAVSRANFMREYVSGRECHSKQLLRYFGESNAVDCGNCEVCRRTGHSEKEPVENLLHWIKSAPRTLEELVGLSGSPDADLISALRELEDEGIVTEDPDGRWQYRSKQ